MANRCVDSLFHEQVFKGGCVYCDKQVSYVSLKFTMGLPAYSDTVSGIR